MLEKPVWELFIHGADTKFIEGRRRLLWDLLDRLMPESALDRAVTGLARHGFERRFGLRYDQDSIRPGAEGVAAGVVERRGRIRTAER